MSILTKMHRGNVCGENQMRKRQFCFMKINKSILN